MDNSLSKSPPPDLRTGDRIPIDVHRHILSFLPLDTDDTKQPHSVSHSRSTGRHAASKSTPHEISNRAARFRYALVNKQLAHFILPTLYDSVRLELKDGQVETFMHVGKGIGGGPRAVVDGVHDDGADAMSAQKTEETTPDRPVKSNISDNTDMSTGLPQPTTDAPSKLYLLSLVRTLILALPIAYKSDVTTAPPLNHLHNLEDLVIELPTDMVGVDSFAKEQFSRLQARSRASRIQEQSPTDIHTRSYTRAQNILHAHGLPVIYVSLVDQLKPRRLIITGVDFNTRSGIWIDLRKVIRSVEEVIIVLEERSRAQETEYGRGTSQSDDWSTPQSDYWSMNSETDMRLSRRQVKGPDSGVPRIFDQLVDTIRETCAANFDAFHPARFEPSRRYDLTQCSRLQPPTISIVLAHPPHERYTPHSPPHSLMPMTMEYHPDYAPGWLHAFTKLLAGHIAEYVWCLAMSQYQKDREYDNLSGDDATPDPGHIPVLEPPLPHIRLINFGCLDGEQFGMPQAAEPEIVDRINRALRVNIRRSVGMYSGEAARDFAEIVGAVTVQAVTRKVLDELETRLTAEEGSDLGGSDGICQAVDMESWLGGLGPVREKGLRVLALTKAGIERGWRKKMEVIYRESLMTYANRLL